MPNGDAINQSNAWINRTQPTTGKNRSRNIAMTMPLEFSIAEGYEISAGLDRMDPVAIHAYLTNGIAVGTAVASRPPHRSVREALPHTALAASRANVKRCQVPFWINGQSEGTNGT